MEIIHQIQLFALFVCLSICPLVFLYFVLYYLRGLVLTSSFVPFSRCLDLIQKIYCLLSLLQMRKCPISFLSPFELVPFERTHFFTAEVEIPMHFCHGQIQSLSSRWNIDFFHFRTISYSTFTFGTRANCYRKVREQVLILIQQHQRISSNSASAASVHQQQQCISSTSASAHQQHQRISSISASAASVHQQHQCISSISASEASAA